MRIRQAIVWVLLAGLAGAAGLVGASSAIAQTAGRTEVLRWVHPDPSSVRSFKVYWGVEPGVYVSETDVGLPTPTSSGVFTAAISVPDGITVYIALSAVGTNGLESRISNVGVRSVGAGGLGAPGQPTPSS